MKWTIVKTPGDNLIRIRIKTVPESQAVEYLFSGIRVVNFPEFLHCVINNSGFHNEVSGVITYSDLDGGDFVSGRGFEDGNVRIYHNGFNDEIVIDRGEFRKMVLEYSIKLLEIYKNSSESSLGWEAEMKDAIKQLSAMVNN